MPETSQEVRDQLKQAVTALAKDDQEAAIKIFHDVLQAKMQARVNPQGTAAPAAEPTPEEQEEALRAAEVEAARLAAEQAAAAATA